MGRAHWREPIGPMSVVFGAVFFAVLLIMGAVTQAMDGEVAISALMGVGAAVLVVAAAVWKKMKAPERYKAPKKPADDELASAAQVSVQVVRPPGQAQPTAPAKRPMSDS